MKGSPLVRAVVLLGVIIALGWPLHWLTRQGSPVAVNESLPSGSLADPLVALPVDLMFSKPALRLELSHLGKIIWAKDAPSVHEEIELKLPIPKEGVELVANVQWPGQEWAALRVKATLPGASELERTVWGAGSVEAVVPLP